MRYIKYPLICLAILAIVSSFYIIIRNNQKLTGESKAQFTEWDLNRDGNVNNQDSDIFIQISQENQNTADFNDDGKTDILDLSILLDHFDKV
jgi:hypothetical protein